MTRNKGLIKTLCRECGGLLVDCHLTSCDRCEYHSTNSDKCHLISILNDPRKDPRHIFCHCEPKARYASFADFYKNHVELEHLRQENILLSIENVQLKKELENKRKKK